MMLLLVLLLLPVLPRDAPKLETQLCPSMWDVERCESACFSGDGDAAACDDAAQWWKEKGDGWDARLRRQRLLQQGCAANRAGSCMALAELYDDADERMRAVAVLSPRCRTALEPECDVLYGLIRPGEEPDQKQERARLLPLLDELCASSFKACFAASFLQEENSKEDDAYARKGAALLEKACLAGGLDECEKLSKVWWQGAGESQLERWRRVAAQKIAAACAKQPPDCRAPPIEKEPQTSWHERWERERRATLLTELCKAGRKESCGVLERAALAQTLADETRRCGNDDLVACRALLARPTAAVSARADAAEKLCAEHAPGACRQTLFLNARQGDRFNRAWLEARCGEKITLACRLFDLEDSAPTRLDPASLTAPKEARSVAGWRVKTLTAGKGAVRGPVLLRLWQWRDGDEARSQVAVVSPGDKSPFAELLGGLSLGERARAWGAVDGTAQVVEVAVVEAE